MSTRQRLTFPEGLTIDEMAKIYECAASARRATSSRPRATPSLIKELDPEAGDLEGYLFPETYPLPRRADASQARRR